MVSSGSAPAGKEMPQNGFEKLTNNNKNVSCQMLVSLTFQLLAKHGEEDGKVNGAGGLLQHLVELLLLHI